MLRAWLGATSLEAFVAHDLHAAPVARPSTVRDPDSVLDWTLLGEVLAGGAARRRALSRRGLRAPLRDARRGRLLYIPARWWHVAACRETALSVSVGVRT